MTYYLDQPLATFLQGATHVEISCISPKRCSRTVVMLTSELVQKAPRARTVGDFETAMRCRTCHCKGWSTIRPARRG